MSEMYKGWEIRYDEEIDKWLLIKGREWIWLSGDYSIKEVKNFIDEGLTRYTE